MKMREEHVGAPSEQIIALLHELYELTGATPMLFPPRSNAHKPMNNSTMLFALYRMGYHSRATTHGSRALASTTLNEQAWKPDVIERQLAHGERNKVRAAYNGERPHQALGNRTPYDVYVTSTGGGASIPDHWKKNVPKAPATKQCGSTAIQATATA